MLTLTIHFRKVIKGMKLFCCFTRGSQCTAQHRFCISLQLKYFVRCSGLFISRNIQNSNWLKIWVKREMSFFEALRPHFLLGRKERGTRTLPYCVWIQYFSAFHDGIALCRPVLVPRQQQGGRRIQQCGHSHRPV